MWDNVNKKVSLELRQLEHLIQSNESLIKKCSLKPPDLVEISALGAMLHSFYSDIENIFKRIAMEIDSSPPKGDAWHQILLETMGRQTKNRPTVISESLQVQLEEYLGFRHVFRHTYSFDLRWTKLAPLVTRCKKTLEELKVNLSTFFNNPRDDR